MFLRLRQLALVAHQLEPVVDKLAAVFGTSVCHRDPLVAQFGLHNALLPFGNSFVEVVAPVQPGTTAGRYLARRGGDGGYMVIADTESLPRWRSHVDQCGVRVISHLQVDDYEGLQLHPRDTGGALLEINTTRDNAALDGAYWPAGPHWQDHVRTDRVSGIRGAVLQAADPAALAVRWGRILQRTPLQQADGSWELALDNAVLRFVPALDGRGDGLAGILLQTQQRAAIVQAAEDHGCQIDAQGVHIGGVVFGV